MKKKMCIIKGDKYNFVLAIKLDEPEIITLGGQEVTIEYKKIASFFGTLYYALRALVRYYDREDMLPYINKELNKIKPSDDELAYSKYCGVYDIAELEELLIEL